MITLLLIIIYLAFISLGLPDALLGSAWPVMYQEMNVPVSYAGIVTIIISLCNMTSSLLSDRVNRKLGTGLVTAISAAVTATALFGFSVSKSFIVLCLFAIPYGLGAGSVDAALNNYVALHYASRHMSWLHCMWGVGASVGPYIMGAVLTGGSVWNNGYRYVSLIQMILTALLFISLPLWKAGTGKSMAESTTGKQSSDIQPTGGKALTIREIFSIPGAKSVLLTFFCYCGVEQTTGLWASSYLVMHHGISEETAAGYASLYFIGLTIGRGLSGFLTIKLDDTKMVRLGSVIIAAGIVLLSLPLGETMALVALLLIGLGSAPIFPCVIHSTPARFGAERSQAIIGVQMASACLGICVMPTLFGLVARHLTVSLLPLYLGIMFVAMVWSHEHLNRITSKQLTETSKA